MGERLSDCNLDCGHRLPQTYRAEAAPADHARRGQKKPFHPISPPTIEGFRIREVLH